MAPTCPVHEDEMSVLHEVATDVKWLIRIGTRWMAFIGASLAIMVPILMSFFIYLSKVESRLCIVEYQLSELAKKGAKDAN